MKNVRIKVIYNRRKKQGNQVHKVEVMVYFNRTTRIFLDPSVKVEKNYFDFKENRVKWSHIDANMANRRIDQMITQIRELEYECIKNGVPFTPEFLKECFTTNIQKSEKVLTFNQFCWKQHEIEGNSPIYRNDLKITLKRLDQFNPQIHFSEINLDFIRAFERFLQNENYSVNSIWKHHKTIKKFLNLAVSNGLFSSDNNPYRHFKVKKEQSARTDLTSEELTRIEKQKYNNKTYLNVKNMFLFACYTGFRISDCQNLMLSHIKKDDDGFGIDLEKIKKVRKPLLFPLQSIFNGNPFEYLCYFLTGDEIKNLGNKMPDRKIFPSLAEQTINKRLKDIAYDVKLRKPLSFHISRHTFGTNIAEKSNGDLFLIMDLMGISSVETAMVYVHQSKIRTKRKIKNINW